MSMTSHPVAFGTIEHTERAGELLAEMVKANEVLAREAHTWWTAARDAAKAERESCAQRVALHSQYPIQTDYDRGYDKARKDAAETLRNMSAYELNPVHATLEQRALTADVFEALDLRPEQFLTDGGLVNRGKLRAAIWYPHDYLPEGHWMRVADPRDWQERRLADAQQRAPKRRGGQRA